MIGGVHHVSDLLAARRAQRVLLEQAERDGLAAADDNHAIVGGASPHGPLGFVEPRSDAEPKRFEAFAPHIKAQLLFKCEGKARRAMIEDNALDAKLVLVQERTRANRGWRQLLPAEGFSCMELTPVSWSRFGEFSHRDDEINRMLLKQIQCIGS